MSGWKPMHEAPGGGMIELSDGVTSVAGWVWKHWAMDRAVGWTPYGYFPAKNWRFTAAPASPHAYRPRSPMPRGDAAFLTALAQERRI